MVAMSTTLMRNEYGNTMANTNRNAIFSKEITVAFSQKPAEISLSELRRSLADLPLEDALRSLEEIKQDVFEKYYGKKG